nr:ankyrin repeat protein [Pandoravirus massiliensis]
MQNLPNEIAAHILSFLPCVDLVGLLNMPSMGPLVQCTARPRGGLCKESNDAKHDPVAAARMGHWHCLCAMRLNTLYDDNALCAAISSSGNLALLQRAHKERWAWDATTTSEAAHSGHINCLRYAVGNGCPLKKDLVATVEQLCASSRDTRRECDTHVACIGSPCVHPVKCRLFDVLVYLVDLGGRWVRLSPRCLVEAAANGRVDVLTLAHPMHLSSEDGIGGAAARHGHIACLVYQHTFGYPWGGYECGEAMLGNHLDCLAYLYENGCPWHRRDREIAARCEDEACYGYAKARGCLCADTQVGGFASLAERVGDLWSSLFSS